MTRNHSKSPVSTGHIVSGLPAPPVPGDCDLTGLPFMPLETRRLLNSDLVAEGDLAHVGAALLLWVKSWERVPASSLPNNDAALAKMAGCAPGVWRRLKPIVMRGWVECSDGLLYHAVIARLALTAWLDRLKSRLKSAKGHNTRWGCQYEPGGLEAAIEACEILLQALPVAMPQACPQAWPQACQAKAEASTYFQEEPPTGAGLSPNSQDKVQYGPALRVVGGVA